MKTILLGTSNPSKVAYFAKQLRDYDVAFLTPRDLGIASPPDENGRDPLENAMAKAAFYGRFHDYVISADSALYIRELPPDDPRQPGLHIKRRPDGSEMNDDQMLSYYAALAHSLGGSLTGRYQNAMAVCCRGQVSGYMAPDAVSSLYDFTIVDTPHPIRHPGWPLDSISIRRSTGKYFVESPEHQLSADQEVLERAHSAELLAFYVEKLGLERKIHALTKRETL